MKSLGLRSWVACTAFVVIAAIGACVAGPPNLGDPDGSIGNPHPGGSCDTPHVGCACTAEGTQAACGEVVRQSGTYVTCSEGKMTCTGGKWGSCVGDTTYIKSLTSTSLGASTQDLQQQPSACNDDPCDPLCTNYVDNGTGLDAGVGLVPTDSGGLTLSAADGSTCQNLQCQQVGCTEAGVSTTITGTVVGGTNGVYGTPDPVPNVLVYVPNAPVSSFAAGVQCNASCSAEVTGSPLNATTTAYDGTFTLTNMPVGANIPIVIQLGRWRRETTVNVPNACASQAVGDIRMPRNKTDSTPAAAANIPFTAVSTGSVDALECVLLKMGVDSAEFTKPGGGGRIEIYDGNGVNAGASTPNEATLDPDLPNSASTLGQYDQALFPCWGGQYDKTANQLANLHTYTSEGGHVFATHYSYTWLYTNGTFAGTANWNVNANSWTSRTGHVDTSFTRGQTLANWMKLLNVLDVSNAPPEFTVTNPRQDMNSVNSPAQQWVYDQALSVPLHYTFDTGNNSCGRVVFSDFHVANAATNSFVSFPNECNTTPMTAQEKVLEFLIYDLASCGVTIPPLVPPYPNPATLVRDYQGVCPAGKSAVWRFFDWETVTPADSYITFQAQTSDTQAGLATATPVVGLGTASGAPITTWVGSDVSAALAPSPSLQYLRVTMTFNPSSDHYSAPTLTAWRQNYDCVDSQ